jgi:hypothetical protein
MERVKTGRRILSAELERMRKGREPALEAIAGSLRWWEQATIVGKGIGSYGGFTCS